MSTQEQVEDHTVLHSEGSRRSFLKSAALASALPAVVTNPAAATPSSSVGWRSCRRRGRLAPTIGSGSQPSAWASSGQRYWKDGRDVYDLIMGLMDYPETDKHPSFTLALQCNFEDGGGGDTLFRFVGSDGVINVSFTKLSLNRTGIVEPSRNDVLKGYNSVTMFANAMQKELGETLRLDPPPARATSDKSWPEKYVVPRGYDERYDHFVNFFTAIREKKPVYENATFGLRAAAPALLCNDSLRLGKVMSWDPVQLKVES